VKLLIEDEEDAEGKIAETDRLWHAVRTIAIADMVMSLDNVLAIAAVAQGSIFLLVLGLAISIPLIVAGAALIMTLLERFPIFVWLGAALLGWVAGEMLVGDPMVLRALADHPQLVMKVPVTNENPLGLVPSALMHYTAAILGVIVVVGLGYLLRRRMHAAAVAEGQVPH
jgi:predicted tellurium resistance membrane protein TerC